MDWTLLTLGLVWLTGQWLYAVFGWAVPGVIKK